MATSKLITLSNLTSYDSLLKTYIAAEDAKSIKLVTFNEDTRVVSFYKTETAVEPAAYTVTLPADVDITGKADKVASATADDIAILDASGNLVDSGKKISDLESTMDTKISTEIGKLNTTVDSDAVTAGEGIQVGVTEAAGVITAVTVTGNFDAKYDAIGAAADVQGSTTETVASVDAKITTLKGAVTEDGSILKMINVNAKDGIYKAATETESAKTIAGTLAELESAIGEGGGVAQQITAAIEGLDATVTQDAPATGIGLALSVTETDGKLTAVSGSVSGLGTAAAADVATGAISADDTTGATLTTTAQVATFVKAQIADLEGAMHFVGVISRNAGETDAQAIARVVTDPKSGDVVVMEDNAKEYIFVDPDPEAAGDEVWREVGDEGMFVKKSTTIAGVDLQDNITKAEMTAALGIDDIETAIGKDTDGALVSVSARIASEAANATYGDTTIGAAIKALEDAEGETNVLEGVQVNGVDLTIDANKKVNVTVTTGVTDGSVAVNGVDVAVQGLGTAAFEDVATSAIADESTDESLVTAKQVAAYVKTAAVHSVVEGDVAGTIKVDGAAVNVYTVATAAEINKLFNPDATE